ncbi:hypothetical protein [Aeromicrobium sp. Leaf291]|uniref:hypothetical protein n=1 Tax=Aeromicrobium sp. Leaf291 TaxID=1736325 RepID=UPI0006FC9F47|nr:hypothetical protein [Aeromicrobium sp. Leaf291]KQP81622.1 hypothetical protein ASF35_16455 [Aeromicrobium sp. Leaf291]
MSTYNSDRELGDRLSDVHGFVDVAACCFGRDVRLIVAQGPLYLEPDEARAIAAALTRAAADVEADR